MASTVSGAAGGGSDPARTLLVLRHAKAVPGRPGADDFSRPLTARGKGDAVAAGRWLRESCLAPDLVLCSPALRTRQTWESVLSGLGPGGQTAEVAIERRLYQADELLLLECVRQTRDQALTLLVVGHNPAARQLAADVTGALDLSFPTCALAVIRLTCGWAATGGGAGELAALWTPKAGPGGAPPVAAPPAAPPHG